MINDWNSLPASVVEEDDGNVFKRRLDEHLKHCWNMKWTPSGCDMTLVTGLKRIRSFCPHPSKSESHLSNGHLPSSGSSNCHFKWNHRMPAYVNPTNLQPEQLRRIGSLRPTHLEDLTSKITAGAGRCLCSSLRRLCNPFNQGAMSS